MKKKLIIIFALCFSLNTAVNAMAADEMRVETDEMVIVESNTADAEFFLAVETVTEVLDEAEIEDVTDVSTEEVMTEIESEINDDMSEEMLPTDIEIETDNEVDEEATEILTEEVTEISTESAEEDISLESETEVETIVSVEIEEPIEISSEYIEAEISDIVIVDEITNVNKRIAVQIMGENLFGKCANIKVRPINSYNGFAYIRSIILDDDISNTIEISLPEEIKGIYQVDVDVANYRETKVFVVGESSDNELKCEANRKTAVITGKSKTAGIKAMMVKIIDNDGNIVYIKQTITESDGSFAVNATLPAESPNYIVFATAEGEGNGYVKTITPFVPTESTAEYNYTCNGDIGDYEDVLVIGKNISNLEKYTFELDYSEYMNDVQLDDICLLTRTKETEQGFCESERIEVISASNGKIRFVISGNMENGKLWSGLLNIIRFERLTDNNVTFTLRIYG